MDKSEQKPEETKNDRGITTVGLVILIVVVALALYVLLS